MARRYGAVRGFRTGTTDVTDHLGEELRLLAAVTEAQRALLRLRHRADARAALVTFVERLGATVAPAHPPTDSALPVDLSVGEGRPVVPVAPPGTPVRSQLERTLPELVQQAQHAATRWDELDSSRREGDRDHVTGAPTRRELLAVVERAVPGEDRLLGLVVGGEGWAIEPFGRMRIDGLVRALADIVRSLLDPTDHWGRLGGYGVAVLALRSDEERTRSFLDEVGRRWLDERGLEVDLYTADLDVTAPAEACLDRLEAELVRRDPVTTPARDGEERPR